MRICKFDEIPSEFFKKIEFCSIESVNEIIKEVKEKGDGALIKYSRQFGDGLLDNLQLTREQIEKAYERVDKKTIEAIKAAISTVREFSEKQLACLSGLETKINDVVLGHRIIPIESAGCYIPGGNYPLPSSAIMTIVPAKAAGVKRIAACSPKIKDVTIAACDLAGADEIFQIGGVQAIAAMAWGTESVKKVDIIAGPGNKFVTAAKKEVFGECGIDFLAGPSEVLIIADETADPKFAAADMLAQCEHDKDARAYLITFSEDFAKETDAYAKQMLKTLKTKEIAKIAYEKSFAVVVQNLNQACEISEKRAPEHLELCIKDAQKHIEKFKNYGSLFIGNYSAEVFGDYCAGTNHTLPTNSCSRYTGGLSVFDFVKIQTYQFAGKKQAEKLSLTASLLAEEEGLFAHKLASDLRK